MEEVSKLIGIISYLPDDPKIRKVRKDKLDKLLTQCEKLFNLPILIITQNWTKNDYDSMCNKHDNIFSAGPLPKLGITGARKLLRKVFLNETVYDYIILLDDDIQLVGGDGTRYLKQIDEHPDSFIEFNKSRSQLMAISRFIYSQFDYDDIEAERGEGFEDRIFYNRIIKAYPERHFKFENTGLQEFACATKDKYSTWYKDQNVTEMLDKTMKMINNIK